MKLLAFPNHVNWFHHNSELALLKHFEADFDIIYLFCKSSLTTCGVTTYPTENSCKACVQSHWEKLANIQQNWMFFEFPSEHSIDIAVPKIPTTHLDISRLKIDKYEIGKTLIKGITRHSLNWFDLDFSDEAIQYQLRQIYRSSAFVYYSMRDIIKKLKVDALVTFNGALFPEEAVLASAQAEGITIYVHERGTFPDTIQVTLNKNTNLQQDVSQSASRIGQISQSEIERADTFLQAPTKLWKHPGFGQQWRKESTILRDLGSRDYDIWVYFDSSEEEVRYVPGKEDIRPLANKLRIFLDSIRTILIEEKVLVVLRMHPNSKSVTQRREVLHWLSELPYVQILWPEDDVDSYALLSLSKLVITSGSTMGMEALHRGHPVVNLEPVVSAYGTSSLPGLLTINVDKIDIEKFNIFRKSQHTVEALKDTARRLVIAKLRTEFTPAGYSFDLNRFEVRLDYPIKVENHDLSNAVHNCDSQKPLGKC
jgi:hypothetical protein